MQQLPLNWQHTWFSSIACIFTLASLVQFVISAIVVARVFSLCYVNCFFLVQLFSLPLSISSSTPRNLVCCQYMQLACQLPAGSHSCCGNAGSILTPASVAYLLSFGCFPLPLPFSYWINAHLCLYLLAVSPICADFFQSASLTCLKHIIGVTV